MRCPKQNVRSWGAKLHVIMQHQLSFGERWLLSPPCISCLLALGGEGGDFTLSWAESWGTEGEEKQATAYLLAGPMESFAVLWPWLVFQSSSLIGGLWKHLRVGHFSRLFFYEGVRMSSCDWSLAFSSAFWTVHHLKPLLFEFCSLYPGNPCLSQAVYSMLSLPLVILKREIPQICAFSRNQHYPLI